MKMAVKGLGIAVLAVMLVFALAGCKEEEESPPPPPPPVASPPAPANAVVNIAAIKGVIAPAYTLTPVTTIKETEQYRGTVTWNGNSNIAVFDKNTKYTATITLTAKTGFTLQGVAENFFTVAGATSVSNAANSGVITAEFSETDSKIVNGITVKTQPTRLTYMYDDTLDLTGLEVTLTYDDKSTSDVTVGNFPFKSITTDPAQGDKLAYYTHNGQSVKITYGEKKCETNKLTINRLTPTVGDFNISGLTQSYDGSPKTVTITPKEGKSSGTITVKYNGSTTAPSAVGTYTVTFDVAATTNYNAVNGLSSGTMRITSIIEMVQIPGGSFDMGSNNGDSNESPVHTVTLSSFYMGKYEVTQEQWAAVMGSNPSYFKDSPASGEIQGKRPVECVSWYNALVFCNKLSMMEGLTPAYSISGSTDPAVWGTVPTSNNNTTWDAVEIVAGSTGYRLPTEAQWEYAARGGNGSPGNYEYSGSNNVYDVAWYSGNSGGKTHEVGKKAPNGLGLYDMSGNVLEWCWDWYGSYSSGAQTDPMGASSGSFRVLRGGSWDYSAVYLRSAYRYYFSPFSRYYVLGFRLVRP